MAPPELHRDWCPVKTTFNSSGSVSAYIIKMKEMAEVLAEKMKFVRVDFYEINGKMYFGEITFYPASGFGALEPEDTDAWLGKLLRV